MGASDVTETLDEAIVYTGHACPVHEPCYGSLQLKDCLDTQQRIQPCGAPYPPMTQSKIEHYPRVMRNVVKRKHEYSPRERGRATGPFAQPCNPERYHESLDTITPADRYLGRYRTPWTEE